MNIYEAIEAMKILVPHAGLMRKAENGIGVVRALFGGLTAINEQEQIGRLLAYTQHRSLDEITEHFAEVSDPAAMLTELAESLSENPIPDLINGAALLGLTRTGWSSNAAE